MAKAACFGITREAFRELLLGLDGNTVFTLTGLPEGARFVALGYDWNRDSILVRVEAPDWPDIPDGDELPRLDVQIRRETLDDRPMLLGLIHDLTSEDGGFARGERAERARVLELIGTVREDYLSAAERGLAVGPELLSLSTLWQAVTGWGKADLPLPPVALAAENERLRAEVDRLTRLTEANP